jgi:hypothetical protein
MGATEFLSSMKDWENDFFINTIQELKDEQLRIINEEDLKVKYGHLLTKKTLCLNQEYYNFITNLNDILFILLLNADDESLRYLESVGFSNEELAAFGGIEKVLDEVNNINASGTLHIFKFPVFRHYVIYVKQKISKLLYNKFPFYYEEKGKKYDMQFMIQGFKNIEERVETDSKKRRNETDELVHSFWKEFVGVYSNVIKGLGFSSLSSFVLSITSSRQDNFLLPVFHSYTYKLCKVSQNEVFRIVYPLFRAMMPHRFLFANEAEYKLNGSSKDAKDEFLTFDEYQVRKIRNFLFKKA